MALELAASFRGVGRRDREGVDGDFVLGRAQGIQSIPTPGSNDPVWRQRLIHFSPARVAARRILLDCGTGARNLGMALMDGPFGKGHGEAASILLSHAHWDRIQGFPFFVPLYQPGDGFHIYGGAQSSAMLQLLAGRTDGAPVLSRADAEEHGRRDADIAAIDEGKSIEVAGCSVRACTNPHGARGARWRSAIDDGARSVVYASDAGYGPGGPPPASRNRALSRRRRC